MRRVLANFGSTHGCVERVHGLAAGATLQGLLSRRRRQAGSHRDHFLGTSFGFTLRYLRLGGRAQWMALAIFD
jgi:hypothetical protein